MQDNPDMNPKEQSGSTKNQSMLNTLTDQHENTSNQAKPQSNQMGSIIQFQQPLDKILTNKEQVINSISSINQDLSTIKNRAKLIQSNIQNETKP